MQTSVPISFSSSSIQNRKPQPNKEEKKRNLKTTSAPQSTPDAVPTGHAAIVLCNCSCLFRDDMLQGRNSFVWHIYLLWIAVYTWRWTQGTQFDAGSKKPTHKPGHQYRCKLKPRLWGMNLKASSPTLERCQIGNDYLYSLNPTQSRGRRWFIRF